MRAFRALSVSSLKDQNKPLTNYCVNSLASYDKRLAIQKLYQDGCPVQDSSKNGSEGETPENRLCYVSSPLIGAEAANGSLDVAMSNPASTLGLSTQLFDA